MIFKLNEVCEFINGGAWSDKEYVESGIPVLKVSNMQSDGFELSSLNYIPETSRSKYQKHLLKKNDLVIATVGSHPSLVNSAAGRTSIISKLVTGYLLNQNALCLRTKDDKLVHQKYLGYLGKTSFFQHFIQQRGRGAANQMRIAIGSIKEFEFDFPDVQIQRCIASILSAYDDLIENNLRRIKLLEELAQRTYEEWFVRFRFPGFETAVFNEETGLPEGWERRKIGDSCIVSGGGTPSRNINEYWENGVHCWYSPTDLTKSPSLYVENSAEKITDLGLKKSSARLLSRNSFMMSSRATIGLFAITDKDFSTNQGFINVTPFENYHKEYLLHNFIGRVDEFKGFSSGATFPEISKSKFKVLDIIWPSEELIKKFNQFIQGFHNQIISLSKQNRLLKESRDILLPRLMSGEIELDELSDLEEGMMMAAEPKAKYKIKN